MKKRKKKKKKKTRFFNSGLAGLGRCYCLFHVVRGYKRPCLFLFIVLVGGLVSLSGGVCQQYDMETRTDTDGVNIQDQ